MKRTSLNQIVITENDYVEVLYRDQVPDRVVVDQTEWIEQLDHFSKLFELPAEPKWEAASTESEAEYIARCVNNWYLPERYQQLDIPALVLGLCETEEQRARVKQELALFEHRNMMPVLRFLKYFVDLTVEHDLVIGVGRGSSVASYVLYLLGVHMIDSLEYDLDIKEFLK